MSHPMTAEVLSTYTGNRARRHVANPTKTRQEILDLGHEMGEEGNSTFIKQKLDVLFGLLEG